MSAWPPIAGFTVLLTLLGVYLAGVKVYDETEEALALRDNPLYAFLVDFSYKRRIFEVLLDVILILLCLLVRLRGKVWRASRAARPGNFSCALCRCWCS